jgi:malonyl CoA-acyl carrier protein transacylase
MGMEVRARSKAARKIWDRADKFTREALGFSVLHVVKDNPTSLIANGVHYQHPEGVLYLTQFTQVAMATTAAAQVAEMREQGAFVEGAIACGHSVGEYTALACVSGVIELEGLLEACSIAAPTCTTSFRATSGAAPTTGWRPSGRRRSTWTTPTSRPSSPRSPSAPVSSSRS